MREILVLLLAGVLADNLICFRTIGIGNSILSTDTLRKSASIGAAITVAGIACTAVIYPIYKFMVIPMGIACFKTLILILVCAAAYYAGKLLMPKSFSAFSSDQGAVMFGTIMGICCICAERANYGYALLSALFYGLGLLLVLCIFFCARLSVKHTRVPKSLAGLPLDLIITAIIALVLYGWQGVA
ncbi:MAG: hypothetical protein IJ426_05860 [Clostridia bacterium]|nr:hypothetical protein [Clostridia bacterium]